jgi:hypothetical protein
MDAADYFDWWPHSGTGLGTASPGETLRQFHQELSRAGAHVVIVGKLLEKSPDVLDLGRWRRTEVWGLEGVQILLTAEALEAIGARGAALAVRGGTGPRTEPPAGEALPQRLNDLRERIVARFPGLADNLPEEVRG